MCGMATLTIDVSISSSTAASVTAIAIKYLCLYLSSSAGGGTEVGRGRTYICAVPRGPDEISSSSVASWSFDDTSALPRGFLRVDMYGHRHAGTQRTIGAQSLLHLESNRNALHDFREIARRVVRRQQRELGTRRGAHAFHAGDRRPALIGIHLDLRRLAHANFRELRFLEVGGDEDARVGDDRVQRLSRLHELARLDLLPRHNPRGRRRDGGI